MKPLEFLNHHSKKNLILLSDFRGVYQQSNKKIRFEINVV